MSPSSVSSPDQAEPLLPPKMMTERQVELPSSTASNAIKALSVLRIAIGAACLVAPRWSCALFQFPIPAAYSVMPRLFGVRDLALGELLLTAEDKNSPNGGRREIKRSLWAGIGCDVADVASIAFGVATGTVPKPAALIFAGGAAAFVGLGALGIRGL